MNVAVHMHSVQTFSKLVTDLAWQMLVLLGSIVQMFNVQTFKLNDVSCTSTS